ncbi:hypothetical protein Y695_04350 [Hydrogenophaga sp. T4]|nr:hypothetical protein Y695_04350 [Hydrogenophaga sp. T4]
MKAVEHGEVTFARHAKGVGHTLGDQAFNEQVSGEFLCHAGIVPRVEIQTVLRPTPTAA